MSVNVTENSVENKNDDFIKKIIFLVSFLVFFVCICVAWYFSTEFDTAVICFIAGLSSVNYGISIYPSRSRRFLFWASLYQLLAIIAPVAFYFSIKYWG